MAASGAAELTVPEVSRESGVSVGGIYRRFANKEALLVAVQERLYERMSAEHVRMEEEAVARGRTLETRIPILVEGLANILRRHAPMIKAIIEASWSHPEVARRGFEAFGIQAQRFKELVLEFRSRVHHASPEHAAEFCFSCVYEMVASYFGFGRPLTLKPIRWSMLVTDLKRLCVSYLTGRELAP